MILLPRPLLEQIENAAEAAWPGECCGLLVGYGDASRELCVTRIAASRNVGDAGRNDRFEVDPQLRFDLMRELEGTEERIAGHYHSHPGQAAEPSAHDLKMAFEPGLVWLIVEVRDGNAVDTRAFQPDIGGKRFDEVELLAGG